MAHEYMRLTHVRHLQAGDIVRGIVSGTAYIVTSVYGDRATAVKVADITNPSEWEVLRPAHPTGEKP